MHSRCSANSCEVSVCLSCPSKDRDLESHLETAAGGKRSRDGEDVRRGNPRCPRTKEGEATFEFPTQCSIFQRAGSYPPPIRASGLFLHPQVALPSSLSHACLTPASPDNCSGPQAGLGTPLCSVAPGLGLRGPLAKWPVSSQPKMQGLGRQRNRKMQRYRCREREKERA